MISSAIHDKTVIEANFIENKELYKDDMNNMNNDSNNEL